MNRKAEAAQLVRAVANQLSQESWYSTQTTAYALIAISKFCGKNQSGSKIIVNGSIAGNSINLNSNANIVQTPVAFTNGKASINITNKGNNVLYVRVINQGQPVSGDSLSVHNNPMF